MFRINPQSGIPIYRQLVEQIRRMVSSGQLKPGDELPSVRNLARDLAVNTMTVSKAYSMLEAEGLLDRQRGKAMTVARRNLAAQSKAERVALLAEAIDQLVDSAQQLNLAYADVAEAIQQRMGNTDD